MSIPGNGVPAPSVSLSRSFLIVTINRQYLAFEAESVMEVATIQELERGDDQKALRVTDLTMQWNSPDIPTDPNLPVVVLVDRGTECCIRVSQVHGRLAIQPSQVLPLPAHFRNGEGQWYRGMILFENSVAFILNPTWIVEESVRSNTEDTQRAPCPLTCAWEIAAHDGRLC